MAGRPLSSQSDAGFPPQARVRAKREFDRVFEHGRRIATPMLVLHILADDQAARLGLAVSRKVDPRAVGRNRIKRILRERFRRARATLADGAYVVVARSAAARASAPELIAAFEQALRRAGALPIAAADGTMPPASSTSMPASAAQRSMSTTSTPHDA